MLDYASVLKSRRKALKLTQEQLAEKAGYRPIRVGQTRISRIEKGKVIPEMATWVRLCDAAEMDLDGNPLNLKGNETLPGLSLEIPVVALAAAGEPMAYTDQGFSAGDGFAMVGRPPDLHDPYAFAVEVAGDSMVPKYEAGQVVIVDTTKPPGNGDYCVVGLHTHERYIKRWRRKGERVYLESVNPDYDPIETKSGLIKFAYKVVWVRER